MSYRLDALNVLKEKHLNDIALKILIPDWDKYFKEQIKETADISVILNADIQSCLDNLTNPIHRFICEKATRKEYVNVLQEKWFDKDTKEDRYKYFNMYFGKIIELMIAYWFSENEYQINDLQAWNASSPDILAKKNEVLEAIEVKYIPMLKDDNFNTKTCGFLDVKSALDNLLSKFNKIQQQLALANTIKTAVIVIENISFAAYFLPLETYNS